MKTINDFKKVKRRHIRQQMFNKQRAEKTGEVLNNKPVWFDDMVKHYESLENFNGWQNFALPYQCELGLRNYKAWDIGVDDETTKLTRPEKEWLFNNTRFEIVMRLESRDGMTQTEKNALLKELAVKN